MLGVLLEISFRTYKHKVFHNTEEYVPSGDDAPAQYYDQLIDHFDNTNQNTFKQKYFVNDTYFKKTGPVVIMIGGEGPLVPKTVKDYYSIDYIAKSFNALKVSLEHRFYGESFPFADSSNLTFLSSRQAIADVSMFIPYLKTQYDITKVILIGGSYSGNLVAWMRAQLPHLVDAVVAASGPFLAENDYPEYSQHVEEQIAKYGTQQCLDAIGIISDALDEMIMDASKYELLSDIFQCPLDEMMGYDELDKKEWAANVGMAIDGVVQYAKAANYDGSGKQNDITVTCNKILMNYQPDNYDLETLLRDYAFALGFHDEVNTGLGYHAMISELRDTDLKNDQVGRSWMWQTCTEFGYYQTSTYEGSHFPKLNDLELSNQMCQDAYFVDIVPGITLEESQLLIEDAIAETNMFYGARNIPRDHIYYTDGTVDPWSELSMKDDLTWKDGQYYNGVFEMIEEGSHCSDMYMAWTMNDGVRQREVAALKEWLGL